MEDFDYEPDLDFGFEFDSAMESCGWGTDEDYGFYPEFDPYEGITENEVVDLRED